MRERAPAPADSGAFIGLIRGEGPRHHVLERHSRRRGTGALAPDRLTLCREIDAVVLGGSGTCASHHAWVRQKDLTRNVDEMWEFASSSFLHSLLHINLPPSPALPFTRSFPSFFSSSSALSFPPSLKISPPPILRCPSLSLLNSCLLIRFYPTLSLPLAWLYRFFPLLILSTLSSH